MTLATARGTHMYLFVCLGLISVFYIFEYIYIYVYLCVLLISCYAVLSFYVLRLKLSYFVRIFHVKNKHHAPALHILVPKRCLIIGCRGVHALEPWLVDCLIHKPYVRTNTTLGIPVCSNCKTSSAYYVNQTFCVSKFLKIPYSWWLSPFWRTSDISRSTAAVWEFFPLFCQVGCLTVQVNVTL